MFGSCLGMGFRLFELSVRVVFSMIRFLSWMVWIWIVIERNLVLFIVFVNLVFIGEWWVLFVFFGGIDNGERYGMWSK